MKLKNIAATLYLVAIPFLLEGGNKDLLPQNSQFTPENSPFFFLYLCKINECQHRIISQTTNSTLPLLSHLIVHHDFNFEEVLNAYSIWSDNFLFSFFTPPSIIRNPEISSPSTANISQMEGLFLKEEASEDNNGNLVKHEIPLKQNGPWLQEAHYCSEHRKLYCTQNGGRTSMYTHLKNIHGIKKVHGSLSGCSKYKRYRCACTPDLLYESKDKCLVHISLSHPNL